MNASWLTIAHAKKWVIAFDFVVSAFLLLIGLASLTLGSIDNWLPWVCVAFGAYVAYRGGQNLRIYQDSRPLRVAIVEFRAKLRTLSEDAVYVNDELKLVFVRGSGRFLLVRWESVLRFTFDDVRDVHRALEDSPTTPVITEDFEYRSGVGLVFRSVLDFKAKLNEDGGIGAVKEKRTMRDTFRAIRSRQMALKAGLLFADAQELTEICAQLDNVRRVIK